MKIVIKTQWGEIIINPTQIYYEGNTVRCFSGDSASPLGNYTSLECAQEVVSEIFETIQQHEFDRYASNIITYQMPKE